MAMIDDLRDQLLAADYTVDAVLARLGPDGQAGLQRNSTMPAQVALAGDRSRLATLIRLFPLAMPVASEDAEAALPVEALIEAGLLRADGDQIRATVDLRPYGFELPTGGQWDGWVVADHTPGLDHEICPTRPDYVLGLSPASTTLAQLSIDTPVGSALDLGTGCGVQSLHLATHAGRVVATDVNPRVHQLAQLTFALNRLAIDLRAGSLYEPVAADRFDLIVTNPPYVMSPPNPATAERLTYRESGFRADDLVHQVVSQSIRHLNPGGSCQVLANWAITEQAWDERLASWAPPGADLWVIERERLDPYAYIEMWLTDAGLAGHPSWSQRYRDWLDYFDQLGIRGIGMGWITVVNAGRSQPQITIESWPHQVHQPVGPAIAAHQLGLNLAAQPDAQLLARPLKLRPDIIQETIGAPGAEDPQHIVLRQCAGLKRALEVDTALAGVLGACDGTLPLGVLIDAVATLLDTDPAQARTELLPQLRQAIIDGYLVSCA